MSHLPLPDKRYGTILADPPWRTATYSGHGLPQRADGQHYPTMSLDELKALPVANVSAPDCCLFMWIISSHIDQGIELAKAWGFKYNTDVLIWRKITKAGMKEAISRNFGVVPLMDEGQNRLLDDLESDKYAKMSFGKWSRKQAEQCFLFTRGKPSPKPDSRSVRQIIDAPIREHSRKPDESYSRIERLAHGPYLELFSHTTAPGWDVWGNRTNRYEYRGGRQFNMEDLL